ncbi:Hypothetical predicted protein [Lecanosticta acicola]|uniref:P-loop containing nucleoside triphosphate hydrolase protein n=1 Tax=Lecanosticta acicola TaxID=111012 RepID=A0AAI9EFF7_9PEZI|nr:Hypothetical predicted protein [Lecanosticta acicola]
MGVPQQTKSGRTRPFEILALGLSRSGTDSLCKALEILGYPCYHGWRTLDEPEQSVLWAQAIEGKYENRGRQWEGEEDFDRILGPYTACTDLPCAMFTTELIDAYPDAKVILNLRPREEWHRSIVKSVDAKMKSWTGWLMCKFDMETSNINRCWSKANGHYFRWDLARNGRQVYDEHAALVRGAARNSQFLEYDPHQGWEPLCAFLNKPVPETPFPSGNVAEEFHSRIENSMKSRFIRAMRNFGGACLVAAGGAVCGYMAWSSTLDYSGPL